MSVQCILTKELGTKGVCSTWVPNFLQAKEMEHSCSVCLENQARISQGPDFRSCVNTIDKAWIHHYNPKMKDESEAWIHGGECTMKNVYQKKSVGKVMLVTFFDC